MPYPPRKQSEGDVYHVITRGVGQQIIFEDDEDFSYFFKTLVSQAQKYEVEIWAWCLMSNHVHLLLRAPIETISKFMQQTKSSYAVYFNKQHGRNGALFQGRFTSVPIETDEQLITAVRYIHLNPTEAGEDLSYKWSSYIGYFKRKEIASDGKELVSSLFNGPKGFAQLHESGEKPSSGIPRRRIEEDEALKIAKQIIAPLSLYDIDSLKKSERNEYIARMKAAGLSVRQISRFTSVGHNIVARA